MVSRTKKQKSVSTPVFQETWLPGQKEYIPQFAQTWKDIFAGDVSSPTAKMLQQMTGEAAMRETGQERRRISETRGLTAPARAKLVGKAGDVGVSAMAKVPQDVWGASKEFLSAYALTPPTVASGTASRTSGGGGWGVCSCYIFKEGNEGYLEESLREFRDNHFPPEGYIDQGYKAMAGWLVPLMKRSPIIKKLTRGIMLIPMTRVARWVGGEDERGFLFIPFMYFWISVWNLYGRVTVKRFKQKTPRPMLPVYPTMTSTFISQLRSTQPNQKVVI